ncbi:MAG: histidine ammonia-lyase [Candidatus Bathyarchaeota archaeon]|jgi:histidine ammonia-lyase
MNTVQIDGVTLSIQDVISVAREDAKIFIPKPVENKIRRSHEVLEKLLHNDKAIYGVNTGFGALSKIRIAKKDIGKLQENLIRSHSCGVGKPLKRDTVRALMLLRLNTLAKGYSGIRFETLQTLQELLNKKVHPVIPEKGSVGASGDLAPLSHMSLVLMGEGEAEYQDNISAGGMALEKAGIKPVHLDLKEGIALNNGTQLMTAIATLATYDSENLIRIAEIATAITLEALLGISDAFDERIQKIRPHKGQEVVASKIRRLVKGSLLVRTGEEAMKSMNRPHDPYSLRCSPQVLGAAIDSVEYVRRIVETEINSTTDNPLVFPDEMICLSAGNFHGQPVSIAMDLLGIAMTMVGNISERRIARLLDEKLNNGLPAFLIHPKVSKGLNSGLMTVQYTAAALASENKVLSHPACVDSIPTSANFEDFVSMGTTAAQKATQILQNVEFIIAIELLCSTQAIEYRNPEKLGEGTKAAYSTIRKIVPIITGDRPLSGDIETIRAAIRSGELLKDIENRFKLND